MVNISSNLNGTSYKSRNNPGKLISNINVRTNEQIDNRLTLKNTTNYSQNKYTTNSLNKNQNLKSFNNVINNYASYNNCSLNKKMGNCNFLNEEKKQSQIYLTKNYNFNSIHSNAINNNNYNFKSLNNMSNSINTNLQITTLDNNNNYNNNNNNYDFKTFSTANATNKNIIPQNNPLFLMKINHKTNEDKKENMQKYNQ